MLLMQSLNKLGSPEQKLGALIKKHAELVSTDINNILPLKHKNKGHLLTSYLIVLYENEIILHELKKKGAFEKKQYFENILSI